MYVGCFLRKGSTPIISLDVEALDYVQYVDVAAVSIPYSATVGAVSLFGDPENPSENDTQGAAPLVRPWVYMFVIQLVQRPTKPLGATHVGVGCRVQSRRHPPAITIHTSQASPPSSQRNCPT